MDIFRTMRSESMKYEKKLTKNRYKKCKPTVSYKFLLSTTTMSCFFKLRTNLFHHILHHSQTPHSTLTSFHLFSNTNVWFHTICDQRSPEGTRAITNALYKGYITFDTKPATGLRVTVPSQSRSDFPHNDFPSLETNSFLWHSPPHNSLSYRNNLSRFFAYRVFLFASQTFAWIR